MARRSTGLQFAIHFRARHTDHAHRLEVAANNNFVIVRLARFGGRHQLAPPDF